MPSSRQPTNHSDPIEALCDEGETRLKEGRPLALQELAQRCEPSRRDRLVVELLLLEFDYAQRKGVASLREEYLSRYPEYRGPVELAFCLLDPDETGLGVARHAFASLSPGGAFSHYDLVGRIGVGATCEVWKGVDRMTGREVALKIPSWHQQSIDQRMRFLREGRALSRLRHPGIVTLFELGRDAALPYLAIELGKAGTLKERLRAGPLTAREAAELCRCVAVALQHAHERDILHRDIKPGNILLNASLQPLLTDFGLAKDSQHDADLTEQGDVLGTPAYMAPEQAMGRSSMADARADVYGAGAVLYECLTGVPPASRGDARDGLDPRRLRPGLPQDLAMICRKATQPDPVDRYETAEALADDLTQHLEGRPIKARNLPRWKQVTRRARPLWGVTLIGALLAALPIAASFSVWSEDGRREVLITVDPPNSRVAFVPLSEWGATLRPGQATFAKSEGEGELRARLAPGPYYAVAVAPDGRFHEVQRDVPTPDDFIVRPHGYRQTELLTTGELRLATIRIPRSAVTEKMTLIEGSANYDPGGVGPASDGRGFVVTPYYIDPEEQSPNGIAPHAWNGSYGDAVDAAERAGKRLPTEIEYEFAATSRGRTRYPWGDRPPESLTSGDTDFDRLALEGAKRCVQGLCTGVAEWATPCDAIDPIRPHDYAVARGGDQATARGDFRATLSSIDPFNRIYLPETVPQQGVGWRGVRSATCPFRYEAMR